MTLNNANIIDREDAGKPHDLFVAQLLATTPLCLRPITDADQPFLADLYATSRPDLHGLRDQSALFNQLIAMQQRVHLTGLLHLFPQAEQWLIERDQQSVGRLVLDWGDTDVRVVDISVGTNAQRSGVASSVLRALQHAATSAGINVTLAVAISNAPAQALYSGLGFQLRHQDDLFAQLVWQPQT